MAGECDLNRLERCTFGPAPPDTETDLIPSGTRQPTPTSWQAAPVGEEPPVGLGRFVPGRQYPGLDMSPPYRSGRLRLIANRACPRNGRIVRPRLPGGAVA